MAFTNQWKSRYGDAYISLPSVAEQMQLDYEILELKKEQ